MPSILALFTYPCDYFNEEKIFLLILGVEIASVKVAPPLKSDAAYKYGYMYKASHLIGSGLR